MYKMINISAETWNEAGVCVIRVHEKDNVNKTLFKLICISDVHEDVLIPIIMQSILSDSKKIKLRSDLGFNQINLILKKE